MDQHIEIEFKNLVNKQEFDKLKEYFNVAELDFVTQENHYFDTPSFELKEKGSALRIRQRNGNSELTLKQPAEDGLLETNLALTNELANDILIGKSLPDNEITRLIESLKITSSDIRYFGTLQTSRAEVPYKGGLLVFDHSSYLTKEDYEVEYEVSNKTEGQEIFGDLLQKLQIPVRKTENKTRRFYQAKFNK
ncbi:CYTH domain-containing protein [Peribacillus cavernae]|uniref:CYTH domain-containing protein n=1 Tax=Peribacillus cavernae TaxID=1674310 RepID=A0A3S0W0M7_9BACI|nr:CYTH domain-containing protein [Peribacillus cavernae]MDQ0217510.1 uncharacterized protein YjbK [Peribacillus cavernae]RUQ30050.1 CYTH domain-containing protein [Peribacillus cavernae]